MPRYCSGKGAEAVSGVPTTTSRAHSSWQAAAYAALALLAERFPHTFVIHEARRRPLKVGIFSEVAAAVNGAIKPHELRAAFHSYTDNRGYLRNLRAGAARIDLDGNEAGVVSAAEAACAAERLATKLLRAANRKTKPATPPTPGPSKPQRLTLADLRQAVQQRRAAVVAAAPLVQTLEARRRRRDECK